MSLTRYPENLLNSFAGTYTDAKGAEVDIVDGTYRILLRSQRVFTDPNDEASYDSFLSPPFKVKRGAKKGKGKRSFRTSL